MPSILAYRRQGEFRYHGVEVEVARILLVRSKGHLLQMRHIFVNGVDEMVSHPTKPTGRYLELSDLIAGTPHP